MLLIKRLASLLAAIALLLSLSPAQFPVLAQIQVNRLSNYYRNSIHGDVIIAGVGLRGEGEGLIELPAMPSGAVVASAYLYWSTVGTAVFQEVTFAGQEITGVIAGHSRNPCEPVPTGTTFRNYVYRADVSEIVVGGGLYSIEGLPDDLEENQNDSHGASLVVIYHHPDDPLRTIFINDGSVTLDSINPSYEDVLIGIWPDDPVTEANLTYIVAGGRTDIPTGDVRFNDEIIDNNIFSGAAGPRWDNITLDVSDQEIGHRVTTSFDSIQAGWNIPNCLAWAATVFSVTTELVLEVEDQLEEFYEFTGFGGVTSAGVGLRGTGTGSIVVDGIPEGSTVERAFLYWSVLGTTGAFEFPSINGFVADGEVIGITTNPCWGEPTGLEFLHYNYRADVTEIVTGNGTYTIGGLPSDLGAGVDSQGASLVVIYRSPFTELYRTVIIIDGGVTLDLNQNTWDHTIENFETAEPLLEAEITYIVADGQIEWRTGNVWLNEEPIDHDVFIGTDGNYWDNLTYDVTGENPTSPMSTQLDNITPGHSPDCIVWVSTIFSITPPQPDIEILYMPIILKEAVIQD
jgi:hypothetical protein